MTSAFSRRRARTVSRPLGSPRGGTCEGPCTPARDYTRAYYLLVVPIMMLGTLFSMLLIATRLDMHVAIRALAPQAAGKRR